MFPVTVGRQGQRTKNATGQIVGKPAAKEGAVTAIVLDDEDPNQETGGRYGKQQRYPITDIERCPHQHPKRSKRQDGDRQFDQAAPITGLSVARQHSSQSPRVSGSWGGWRRLCLVAQ